MASTQAMSAKQAKGNMKAMLIVSILCFVGAIVYAIARWDYVFMGNTINLNQAVMEGKEPTKGDYATLNLRLVLGNYAETQHKINGFIPAGTEQHYVVVLDDGTVMSVTLKDKSDIKQLEAMVDPTWSLLTGETETWPGTSLTLTGQITNMDSKIQAYYKEALSKAGVTTDQFPRILNLTLDATNSRFRGFLVFGILLLFGVILLFVSFAFKKKKKEMENVQDIARANAADPALNPFLNPTGVEGNAGNAQNNADGTGMPGAAVPGYGVTNANLSGGIDMPGQNGGIDMPNKNGGIDMPGYGSSSADTSGGIDMPGYGSSNPAGGIDMPGYGSSSTDTAGGIDMPGYDSSTAAEDTSDVLNRMDTMDLSDFGSSETPNDASPNTGYDIPEMDPFAMYSNDPFGDKGSKE